MAVAIQLYGYSMNYSLCSQYSSPSSRGRSVPLFWSLPWVQFSSRTNFGYSGIPSVSSPPSSSKLAHGNPSNSLGTATLSASQEVKEEGARREEGKRRRGVLFANFHDLSRGAGGEREDLQVRSGVARDKAGRMVEYIRWEISCRMV